MRTIIIYILVLFTVEVTSCGNGIPNEVARKEKCSDTLLYNNYIKAITNEGTFQYFVVIKAKNKRTGEVREICTSGNFLSGALHEECGIDYDSTGEAKIYSLLSKNREMYFEFTKESAMNNVGMNNYTTVEYETFENTHNIDSLVNIVKGGKWSMKMPDDKTMLLYAHSLFNRGILTGEYDCFGGPLVSVDDKLNE
ncbi:hypothetical protein [Alistipes sp. ZOR0009]|uniref:hypothetical protein n=1 Tax=Alistipes sp. ZOR0009 TaxID=1339253 RepID=UPI0006488E4A|nr:hypothetical protein [Alistipes sp. ZOR0009]